MSNDPEPKLLSKYKNKLGEPRQAIVRQLAKCKWFVNTSPQLQEELITLPQTGAENHDGFLLDLAQRPERMGGIEVLSLHSLNRGAFALIPRFNVRSISGGHEYTYEYVSWRHGPTSGAKGIVFIGPSPSEAPTHFVVLVGEKFAPGKKVYDTIGGFIDLGVEGVESLADRILIEIKQETGVEDMKIDKVVDLGKTYTDVGMTNNQPGLFAAFISSHEAGRIPMEQINSDIYELRSGVLVLPMAKLKDFCKDNTDAFFFTTLVRGLVSEEMPAAFKKAVLAALSS